MYARVFFILQDSYGNDLQKEYVSFYCNNRLKFYHALSNRCEV